jgi:hypothetical protein
MTKIAPLSDYREQIDLDFLELSGHRTSDGAEYSITLCGTVVVDYR